MSLASAIARRPGRALAVAAVLSIVALWPASRFRLETGLADLLPAGSRAADDYRVYLEEFGGFTQVFVLVRAPGVAEGERNRLLAEAAERLVRTLETSPLVSTARSGIEPADEEFLLRHVVPRAALLVPDDSLRDLEARLAPTALRERARRVHYAVTGPTVAFERRMLAADPLGLAASLPGLSGAAGLTLDPLSSTFMSEDGDAALVILTPASSELDAEGGRELAATLERAFTDVRGELGESLRFSPVGGPLWAVHDEAILRQDLEVTVFGSLAACGLLLLAVFGGVSIPLAGLVSLACALLWAFALVGLTSGGVSAVGVGFAAVLVGLGIDYGIHGGVRYRTARLAGSAPRGALESAFAHAGPGIVTSAATTAAAFAVLTLADLKPLAELGRLVAIGILCILFSTVLVGSALLVLTPAPRQRAVDGVLWRGLGRAVELTLAAAVRRPRWTLGCAIALSVVAAAGVSRVGLDADLRAARPSDHPQLAAARELAERFGIGLDTTTVMVPGRDLSDALAAAGRARQVLADELGADAVSAAADAFLAGERKVAERLGRLADLPLAAAADTLEAEFAAAGLDPRAFSAGLDAMRSLGRGEDPAPFAREAWPEWLAALVHEDADGARVAINLHLAEGRWDDGPPARLVAQLEDEAPGVRVASVPALARDLRSVAGRDLSRLSALAFAAVAAVVLLSFRGRLTHSLLALIPVLAGSLWALGLWGLAGRSLDLVSLAVVPIMLGIGIDDGLHVVHGARRDPARGMTGATRAAGRAIALTSLTTCLGFGTLSLSHVPGLANGGLLVVVGVAASLLATLTLLPALASAFPGLVSGHDDAKTR